MMMYIMIALLLAGLGGGFYGGCAVQKGKIERLQADKAQLEANLTQCQEVNKDNLVTVEALKSDIAKTNKSCASRVASKTALLKELQKIDSEKPTGGKDESTGDVTDNPILDRLNKLWPSTN